MTTTETQFFSLLRAGLWNAEPSIEGEVDWKAVMKIAMYHGNNVLIGDVALRLTSSNAPSPDMKAKMQASLRSNLFNHLELKKILVKAVEALRKEGIEPVLLKGFGLAQLYPNPNLRQFGDLDIFVGLDRFHEACTVLRTLPGGYNWGEEVDSGHQYNIEFGRYPMEVHRVSADVVDPAEYAIYSQIEHNGLVEHPQRVDLGGFEISIPSKEFMVFFTFFHAWHHFLTSGIGWRQISDVAVTLHAYHGQLDTDTLHRWITDMHLMQPWQTFGWLMVHDLGLSEAEMPFYNAACRRRAQRLHRRIMEEGNFKRDSSFKRHKPRNAGIRRKLHSFALIFVDFFHIARVFPDAAFRGMRAAFKASLKKNLQKK